MTRKGWHHSEETKRKIGLASARNAKFVMTPEVRLKISNSLKGRHPSDETRKKLSLARMGDKNVSKREDVKEKIRQSKLGKKRAPFTDEARRNMSEAHKGKRSNWQGGKTALGQLIRSSANYDEWRVTIFKRDDYTCQICGERGGRLQVDHIERFAQILVRNNIHSLEDAIACLELWDINNGRVLCVPCHAKTPTFCNKKQKTY